MVFKTKNFCVLDQISILNVVDSIQVYKKG